MLGGHLGMLGRERLVLDGGHHQAVAQPFGVVEAHSDVVAVDCLGLRGQAALPEVECSVRAHTPLHRVHHPRTRPPAPNAGVLEERDVAAGRPLLVRVEEVVDGRVVLVDGLLHEPEAEDACVEVDVPRRIGRDTRDMVDAVERHRAQLSQRPLGSCG